MTRKVHHMVPCKNETSPGLRRLVAVAAMAALSGALPASAETLPFWGDADPATNRTSASSQSVSIEGGAFESRICSGDTFALQHFSSVRIGTAFILR